MSVTFGLMRAAGGGLDDGDDPPPSGAERSWIHPSEAGLVRRGHRDRQRSARLAGLFIVAGLVLLGGAAGLGLGREEVGDAPDVTDDAPLRDMVAASVAAVTVMAGGTERSLTGIVLDDDGHVVVGADGLTGADAVWVSCGGEPPVPAAVIAADPGSGVAVVRTEHPAGRPFAVGEPPRPGAPATEVRAAPGEAPPVVQPVVLTATGVEWAATGGTVRRGLFSTGPRRPAGAAVTTVAAAAPARADGAVFDRVGRLIGLVVEADAEGSRLALPAPTVLTVARTLIDSGEPPSEGPSG